jgi:DNA-binding LacI/PurR family transcriptional regulator
MSIDGFNLAAIQDVPLTAVHVPRDELGRKRCICFSSG